MGDRAGSSPVARTFLGITGDGSPFFMFPTLHRVHFGSFSGMIETEKRQRTMPG